MSIELFINATFLETRLALKDKDEIQEVYIESNSQPSLVGNIYHGKVARVLVGMQAAFIDIGLPQNAWLKIDEQLKAGGQLKERDQLREGQWLQVQVIKDAVGDKGPQVSNRLTLSSHYLVYTPNTPNISVSKRIHSTNERQRLADAIQPYIKNNDGFIVRTQAKNCSNEQLINDAVSLKKQWSDLITAKSPNNAKTKKIQCIHQELSPALRFVRDNLSDDVQKITVDNQNVYQELLQFSQQYWPDLTAKIAHDSDIEPPLFERVGAEYAIQNALIPQVPLPNGGYLIIEQTEAMVTIDINSGSFVGDKSANQTFAAVNLEAMKVIAQQIRLRQLNGMILIDCIGRMNASQQKTLKKALEQALKLDNVQSKVYGFTALGLLEMTRQRVRPTLEQTLCMYCPSCDGLGHINSLQTAASQLVKELQHLANQYKKAKLVVCVSSLLNDWMQEVGLLSSLSNEMPAELFSRIQVRVVSFDRGHITHFNIVME